MEQTATATTMTTKIRDLFNEGQDVKTIFGALKADYEKEKGRPLRYQHVRNEVLRYQSDLEKFAEAVK